MTVASEDSRKEYAGNSVTTSFDTSPVVFFDSTDLTVYVTNTTTGESETLVESTDYTVTGGDGAVGTVATTGLYGAPATGTTLIIVREVPATQETDLVNNDASDAEVMETALDKLTMLIQQLLTSISRTFHLNDSSVAVTDYTLPSPEANSGLGWNAAGTALVNYAFQVGGSLVDLTASTGSSLIGFLQSGASAVARTVQDKLREQYPSVDDFGAVGDGATNDTAAFTAAQAAHTHIKIPTGKTYLVSSGLHYWQFFGQGTVIEPGITWDLSPVPQDDYTMLKAYKKYTWGTFEHAAAASITAASALSTGLLRSAPDYTTQAQENTQVLGTSGAGLRSTVERSSVALNTAIATRAQDTLATTTVYTATSVAHADVATLISAGKLKRGMIIDVAQAADRQSSTHTGTIQSWGGTTITVDAWYTLSDGSVATPSNGTSCVVNPVNKIWGQNSNVYLQEDNIAAAGYELGVLAASDARALKAWGFDCVSLSGTKVWAPFVQRGKAEYAFLSMNYPALGVPEYGFTSEAATVHSFHARNPGTGAYAFSVATGATADAKGNLTVGGALKWAVNNSGDLSNDYRMNHLDTDTAGVSAGGVISAIANVITNVTAGRALLLPTAVGCGGRCYTINSYQQCTLAPQGGQTLDASTAAYYLGPRSGITVQSDGANWGVISVSGYAAWETPAFSAGDYTGKGSMTWTVASGDVTTMAYKIVGKTMTVQFSITTSTIGGTPDSVLYIAIPAGKTAAKQFAAPCVIYNNSVSTIGYCYVAAGISGKIGILKVDASNFVAEADATIVQGQIEFEIA